MIYATDLDRTLIFSNKFIDDIKGVPYVCVDKCKEREISYMTCQAFDTFNLLKQNNQLYIIPTTTRSLEQYRQVSVVQDCEYAITTNGGVILYKGEVLKEWEVHIKEYLLKYTNEFDKIEEITKDITYLFEGILKLVDGIFFYVKLQDDALEIVSKYLEENLNFELWTYTVQGRKMYIIPKDISKENALKFLKGYLKSKFLIVSGDGKLDKGMLKEADMAIIPNKSEVLNYIEPNELAYVSVPDGLMGTYDLLKVVEKSTNLLK